MSEPCSLRCPDCDEDLSYAGDYFDDGRPLADAERWVLELHIRHEHDVGAQYVRAQFQIEEAAIPKRFRSNAPERPTDPEGDAAWQQAAEWYRDSRGDTNLLVYGAPGVGKSTLAARILLTSIEGESYDLRCTEPCFWIHMGDFVRRARRLLATGQNTEFNAILDRAQGAWLLVVDDLGAERVTDFARDLVADLIESRYDADRTLIVTSNFAPDELASRLAGDDPVVGDRLVGRLCEDAEQIRFGGRDRRVPVEEEPVVVLDDARRLRDARQAEEVT